MGKGERGKRAGNEVLGKDYREVRELDVLDARRRNARCVLLIYRNLVK